MELVIHHNFGTVSSKYDTFSNILYKTVSNLISVKKATKSQYNLATSTTKSLNIECSGDFTLNSKDSLIKSGSIDQLTIKRADNYLGTSGFNIVSITDADIGIHDFLMSGNSNKTSAGYAKKFLKRNDSITGSSGDDFLGGYRGHDTIRGGLGADVLYGGHGKDHFVYESIEESGTFASTTTNGTLRLGGNSYIEASFNDIIIDFRSGRDKIDLTALNLSSKKSLSIVDKTFIDTDNDVLNTSYSLWVDSDMDGNTDMVISFAETQKPLKLNDVLI